MNTPGAALAALLAPVAAVAQGYLYSIHGSTPAGTFGQTVAAKADLDGDGIRDVLVAAPSGPLMTGEVSLLSGATGSRLWTVAGENPGDEFGACVDVIGDVTQDQRKDLIVGAPGFDVGLAMDCGAFYVLDGRTGQVVRRHTGNQTGDRLGQWVCAAGDADVDGYGDYAATIMSRRVGRTYRGSDGSQLAQYTETQAFPNWGRYAVDTTDLFGFPSVAWCRSTINGAGAAQVFRTLDLSTVTYFALASKVAPLGVDLDGDNLEDILGADPPGTGVWICRRFPVNATNRFPVPWTNIPRIGECLAPAGDANGDGIGDFLVGCPEAPGDGTRRGGLLCYSGVPFTEPGTPQLLWQLLGNPYEELGSSCAGLGDVNGDGLADFTVGSARASTGAAQGGRIDVMSARSLRIVANRTGVPLSTGGTQVLSIDLGTTWSGSTYLVLGTISGSQPPTVLSGITVPLVLDFYSVFTLTAANSSNLVNTLGLVDGQGRATCSVVVPPGLPVGPLALQHCCLWFDATMALRGSTGTVPLRLER